jgi:hypothetical protein
LEITYREKVVEITSVTVSLSLNLICAFGLDLILVVLGLLCLRSLGEGIIFAVTQLVNNHLLLLAVDH